MLNEISITTNISALSSSKNAGGTYDALARIGASIPIGGNWNTSKGIIDQKKYAENRDQAMSDYDFFERKVEELAEKLAPVIDGVMKEFNQELEKELAQK